MNGGIPKWWTSGAVDNVFVVTHQELPLQDPTAAVLRANKKVPQVVLVHPDFPHQENLIDSNPSRYYSHDGELPPIVARRATVVGGHLDECFLTSVSHLIRNVFTSSDVNTIEIRVLPSLVYPRDNYATLFDYAQQNPAEAARKINEFTEDLVKTELPLLMGKGRKFSLVPLEVPIDPSKFGWKFQIKDESTGKDRRDCHPPRLNPAGGSLLLLRLFLGKPSRGGPRMKTEHVTLQVSDGTQMNAYVAHPEHGDKAPGIIVFQEIFGVNAHIRDVTERFAKAGFAIAPELFHRTAPGFESGYVDMKPAFEQAQKMTRAGMEADAVASHDWLRQHGVAADRVSSVGYCAEDSSRFWRMAKFRCARPFLITAAGRIRSWTLLLISTGPSSFSGAARIPTSHRKSAKRYLGHAQGEESSSTWNSPAPITDSSATSARVITRKRRGNLGLWRLSFSRGSRRLGQTNLDETHSGVIRRSDVRLNIVLGALHEREVFGIAIGLASRRLLQVLTVNNRLGPFALHEGVFLLVEEKLRVVRSRAQKPGE